MTGREERDDAQPQGETDPAAVPASPVPAPVDDGGDLVWRDKEETVGTGPVVRQRRPSHRASMQTRVLYGIGGVIALTLVLLVLAVCFSGITEDFAFKIAQIVLPAAVGAGATVVGTLFVSDRRGPDS